MASTDIPGIETKAILALISALALKLVQAGALSISDATEPYDAALAALEGLPHDEVAAQLRLTLEHAASRLAAAVTA